MSAADGDGLHGAAGSPATYSYAYTLVDPTGGETAASPTSTTSRSPARTSASATCRPASPFVCTAATTGFLTRVAELPDNSSSIVRPTRCPTRRRQTMPVLPQSQNRIHVPTATGYQDFAPGGYAPLTSAIDAFDRFDNAERQRLDRRRLAAASASQQARGRSRPTQAEREQRHLAPRRRHVEGDDLRRRDHEPDAARRSDLRRRGLDELRLGGFDHACRYDQRLLAHPERASLRSVLAASDGRDGVGRICQHGRHDARVRRNSTDHTSGR